jgi:hypothetical protein
MLLADGGAAPAWVSYASPAVALLALLVSLATYRRATSRVRLSVRLIKSPESPVGYSHASVTTYNTGLASIDITALSITRRLSGTEPAVLFKTDNDDSHLPDHRLESGSQVHKKVDLLENIVPTKSAWFYLGWSMQIEVRVGLANGTTKRRIARHSRLRSREKYLRYAHDKMAPAKPELELDAILADRDTLLADRDDPDRWENDDWDVDTYRRRRSDPVAKLPPIHGPRKSDHSRAIQPDEPLPPPRRPRDLPPPGKDD